MNCFNSSQMGIEIENISEDKEVKLTQFLKISLLGRYIFPDITGSNIFLKSHNPSIHPNV